MLGGNRSAHGEIAMLLTHSGRHVNMPLVA
jgi:hypothetical protein